MKKYTVYTHFIIMAVLFQAHCSLSMKHSHKTKRHKSKVSISTNNFISSNKKNKSLQKSLALQRSKSVAALQTNYLKDILQEDFYSFHNTPCIPHNKLMITPMHYAIVQENLPLIQKFMQKIALPYSEWILNNKDKLPHQFEKQPYHYVQIASELQKYDICDYFLEEQHISSSGMLVGAITTNNIISLKKYFPHEEIAFQDKTIINNIIIQHINELFDQDTFSKKARIDSSGNKLYKKHDKLLFLHDRLDIIAEIPSFYDGEKISKKLWKVFFAHYKILFSKNPDIYLDKDSQDFIYNFDSKKELLKHFFELLFTNTIFPQSPQPEFARKILSIFYAHYFPYSKITLPLNGSCYKLPKKILTIYIKSAKNKLKLVPCKHGNNIPNLLHQACQRENHRLIIPILKYGYFNINQENKSGEKAIDIIFEKMKNNFHLNVTEKQKPKNKLLLKAFARLLKKNALYSQEMIHFITTIENEYLVKIIQKSYINTILEAEKQIEELHNREPDNTIDDFYFL